MTSTKYDADILAKDEDEQIQTLIPLINVPNLNKNSADNLRIQNAEEGHSKASPGNENTIDGVPEDTSGIGFKSNSTSGECGGRRFLGLVLALISALMFSLNALMVKLIKNMNPFNVCLWTFPISAMLTIPILVYGSQCQNQNVFKNILPVKENIKTLCFVFLRAMTSVGALMFLYFSLKYLEVGDAIVIASSSTVFVYFIGWIFLREEISFFIIATGVFTLAGVAIITKPPLLTGGGNFDVNLLVGAGLAFGCMILVTIAMIAVRYLQNVHHALLNFFLYSFGTVQSLVLASVLGVLQIPQGAREISLIIASGVLGLLAQTFLAIALQVEQVGPVALIRSCEVIFAFIWQIAFLSAVPDILSLIGALMIVVGVVVTIVRKWILSMPENERPCLKSK